MQAAFLPLLALLLGRILWPQGLRRHYPVLIIVLLLVTEWGVLYGWVWTAAESARLAVWIIAALMCLIIGRVLPFFMQRGLHASTPLPANTPMAERIRLLSALAVVIATAYAGLSPDMSVGLTALLACVVNGWNWLRLYRAALWRVPLLWSLYLSYGWLVIAYGPVGGVGLWLDRFSQLGVACADGRSDGQHDARHDGSGQSRAYRTRVTAFACGGVGALQSTVSGAVTLAGRAGLVVWPVRRRLILVPRIRGLCQQLWTVFVSAASGCVVEGESNKPLNSGLFR